MVTSQIKPLIVENMPPFQIGAVPGHRAQEHLFTIKSFIALKEKENEAVAVNLLDLVKFFDSESLLDTLNELYKGNVKGDLYRLLYEMNKDTRIKVRTPVGDSEIRETGETVTQGSIEAGISSSMNLGNGVNDFFQNCNRSEEGQREARGRARSQPTFVIWSKDQNSSSRILSRRQTGANCL